MIFRKIKRNTLIIVLSVILLTVLTMNITYSYIFSVQGTSNVQTFKAGTLDVSLNSSTKMSATELMPSSASDYPTASNSTPNGDSNSSYATLLLNNASSSLNAKFTVSIDYDTSSGVTSSDYVDMSYIKIGIYDVTNSNWVDLSSSNAGTYSALISSFNKATEGYPILSGLVNSATSRTYRIYVWLSDTTPESEIGKYVNLKLNVKSVPEDQASN